MLDLKDFVIPVPDYPLPGVMFRDITPLLGHPGAFSQAIRGLVTPYEKELPDVIVGIDARGFWFGTPVAFHLQRGFVPARKPDKLPRPAITEAFELEYGSTTLSMHTDAFERFTGAGVVPEVLLVDDVIATGGTLLAAARLVQRLKGRVMGAAAFIDLPGLEGSKKLRDAGIPVNCLLEF
jgi:adenine phosphoribosyltransferase